MISTNNTNGTGTPKTSSEVTLQCAEILASSLNVALNRESRAKFISTCGHHAICCLVSKDHQGQGKYWFGIFDHQLQWLDSLDVTDKWFSLACGGPGLIFKIPLEKINQLKETLSSRYLGDRDSMYWHVNIKNIEGQWKLMTLKEYDNFILDDYKI